MAAEFNYVNSFSNISDPEEFLPLSVPHHGGKEDYFIGSGVAGAAGKVNGTWNFLIGPDYTSPNFIKSETILLIIDGQPSSLTVDMHRGRKTGIFYGICQIGDICTWVIDYSNFESPWVARMFIIKNNSLTQTHRVGVQATIVPEDTCCEVLGGCSLSIMEGTDKWCFGNRETRNWADRYSLITFNVECSVSENGTAYELASKTYSMAPEANISMALYHYQYYGESQKSYLDYIRFIKARNIEEDLKNCIVQWQNWIDAGNMYENSITDSKARDIIEGSLLAIKMQQNRDGGIIAGIKKYANSYVRDCHGGARLLGITGHEAEIKKIILNIYQKWSKAGFIPNWWSMGSDTFIGHSFHNDVSEVTAYYILLIRDYYGMTQDIEFVDSICDSIKWAVDAQIDFMSKNDWKIDFNGDETEQYCCKADGEEYGGFPAIAGWDSANWSFASAAVAVASIQFYIKYLKIKGKDELCREYESRLESIKNAIDDTFWREDFGIHDWMRSKGDIQRCDNIVTNYNLLPLWIGALLNENRQNDNALAMKKYINTETGFLPNSVEDVKGFCGHSLGLLLFALKKLDDPEAEAVYKTITTSGILSCWGTVSEFYGPGGVPNGHNYRAFESGPLAEAVIRYFIGF